MKTPRSLPLLVLLVLALGGFVHGDETRTALIIGCDYVGTGSQLPSPVKDAEALATKLREAGFPGKDITVLKNPGRKQMLDAIDAFGQALVSRGGAGLFYFSGHGCQHEGENYLIPAGASLKYREDLPTETVAASRVVTRMEAAANPVNLLFLDACRTNELPSGKQKAALGKGLASMGGSGLLIGFAAAANRPSLDSGEGSFYTNALVRHMMTPGLSVLQMLTRVRQDVKKATGNEQEPFLYAGLDNDFFFVPESKTAALTTTLPTSVKPSTALIPAATPKPSGAPSSPSARSAPLPATAGMNPAIATVDMSRLFNAHPQTKGAEAKINADRAAAKKELDDMTARATRVYDEVNKLDADLAGGKLAAAAQEQARKRRAERSAVLTTLNADIKTFVAAREKELQVLSLKLRTEIVEDMNRALKATPGLDAATLIFDKSGASLHKTPMVVYSAAGLDRSGAVLKQIGASSEEGAASAKAGSGLNIAIIDMKRVFETYYRTKEMEDKINDALRASKKELDDRNEDRAKAAGTLKKLDEQLAGSGLSAATRSARTAERATKAADLQAMEKEIKDFQTLREKQLGEQAARLRTAILSDINQVIAEGAEGEGRVDLILETGGATLNSTPFLLHLDGIPDWTDSVLTTLNSEKGGAKKTPIGRANGSVSTAALRFAVVDMKRVFGALPATKAAEDAIRQARERAKTAGAGGADQQARDKELQDLENRKRAEIVELINKHLFERASKAGFHVVMDSTGQSLNGVPFVTLRKSVPDLSEEIIVALGGKVE